VPRDRKRYTGDGHFHFITFSCYHRRLFLDSARRRDLVLRVLEQTRLSYHFGIVKALF
jgi:putative transposase